MVSLLSYGCQLAHPRAGAESARSWLDGSTSDRSEGIGARYLGYFTYLRVVAWVLRHHQEADLNLANTALLLTVLLLSPIMGFLAYRLARTRVAPAPCVLICALCTLLFAYLSLVGLWGLEHQILST